MGDFLKNVFGGSKSESTSMPVDMTPRDFRALRTPLASAFRDLLAGDAATMFNVPKVEGPLVAPLTDAERATLGQLGAEGGTRGNLIEKTLAGNFLPGQPGANPFLEEAIRAAQRPTVQALEETLSRTLPGRFTVAGQFVQPQGSSAFDRAAAIATRGAADALSDIATNISFAGYESERNRQQQAISLSQGEVDTMISKLQAQGLPRMIEDLGIERGLQEFQTRMAAMVELLRNLTAATSPTLGTVSQSASESMTGIVPALFPKGVGGGSAAKPA